MILPWSTSKDKLVLTEEGKLNENLEKVPKTNCRKFMTVLKVIIVIEIAIFLGWAGYSYFQNDITGLSDIEEKQLDDTSVSALKNQVILTSTESPEKYFVKNQDSTILPVRNSIDDHQKLPFATSPGKLEIEDNLKNEVTTEANYKTTTEQKFLNSEIKPPNGIITERFSFRISLRPKTENEVNQEKEKLQSPDAPLQFRLIFNSDPNNKETESDESILNFLKSEIPFFQDKSQVSLLVNNPELQSKEEEVPNGKNLVNLFDNLWNDVQISESKNIEDAELRKNFDSIQESWKNLEEERNNNQLEKIDESNEPIEFQFPKDIFEDSEESSILKTQNWLDNLLQESSIPDFEKVILDEAFKDQDLPFHSNEENYDYDEENTSSPEYTD